MLAFMHRQGAIFAVLAAVSFSAEQSGPSVDRMRADIEFLSSPPLEGRVSLGKGAEIAARFVATEFRKAGLRPAAGESFLQEFALVPLHVTQVAVRVRHDGESAAIERASVAFGDSPGRVHIEAPVVFAGYGITAPEYGYDDYAGLDVHGKAVAVFDHEPQEADPNSVFNGTGFTRYANAWLKTWNAQRHGAVAVLVASDASRHRRVRTGARPAVDRGSAPPQALVDNELRIPRFNISESGMATLLAASGKSPAAWQAEIDRSLKPVSRALPGASVELEAANEESRPQPSWNVAGLLEGADAALKSETVLVTSHYDHLGLAGANLYAGANDNASGTAAVMEIARLFAAGPRPKRSVLFVSFGSEEQMLLGSFYYVAHPLRPLETTRAVINLDMIARDEEAPEEGGNYQPPPDPHNDLSPIGAVFFPKLRDLIARENREVGLRLSDRFDRESSTRALFRCDHLPFLIKGVPAVWLFGGWHPGYHTPADTVEKLDFGKLEKVTRLAYLTARAIAEGR